MNAVVTGASSGVGKELYEWLLGSDYYTIGVSRRGPDGQMDLRSLGAREDLFTMLAPRTVDVWINNAGVIVEDEWNSDWACLRDMVCLNLESTYDILRRCEGVMALNSVIINIASISGIRGDSDFPLYSATKAGVIALTKAFAKRYVSRTIRVNCISPGLFDGTELFSGSAPQEVLDTIPMRRGGELGELIPVVECIIKCKFMTGANIVVDGGDCNGA